MPDEYKTRIMQGCLQRNMTELTLATFCSQLNHNNFNAISHSLQAEPPFVFLVKKKVKAHMSQRLRGTELPPSSMWLVPIYTPGWRETKWSKVPCLRQQHDRRGLKPRPPDPEFEVLTTWPHTPPILYSWVRRKNEALPESHQTLKVAQTKPLD